MWGMRYVKDNQRLATWRQRTARREAVDYPAYSMVIYQVIDKLKLVLLFAAQVYQVIDKLKLFAAQYLTE